MEITGPLSRAARALIEWPREQVAALARLDVETLRDFEYGRNNLSDEERASLKRALEEGGAVFLPEAGAGVGVRLKFTRQGVKAINRWESEGGPAGQDDV